MNFRAIEDEEWRGCQYLRKGTEVIRRNAKTLLAALKEEFSEGEAADQFGLEFSWDSEDVVSVSTPGACGRMRLVWDANKNGVIGRYVVERKDVSSDDSTTWTPVWALLITSGAYGGTDEHFAFGDDLKNRFSIGRFIGPRRNEGFFVAGMSIAYALNSQAKLTSS